MKQPRTDEWLQRSDAAATYGLLAIGAIHTGMTPVFKPGGGEDALWFAGSGLALIFLGQLNLLRRAHNDPATLWCCRSANLLALAYMALVTRALPKPHITTVTGLVALATAHAFRTPVEAERSRSSR